MTVSQVPSLTSFTAGATISSADVNSNFAALRNAFNALVTADNTLATSITGLTLAGDLKLSTAGNGFYVKEGTNATMGTATLSGGSVTVNTTKVTANSRIFLCKNDIASPAVPDEIYVSARVAGTSFTIGSANSTSDPVAWFLVEPA